MLRRAKIAKAKAVLEGVGARLGGLARLAFVLRMDALMLYFQEFI